MERQLFYLPSLHRNAAPAEVPDGVLFFPCGLPEDTVPEDAAQESPQSGASLGRAIRKAIKAAMPLGEKEASAVLGEMLGMGDTYRDGGFLRQLYASQSLLDERFKWEGAPGEFADLDAFTASGGRGAEQHAAGEKRAADPQDPQSTREDVREDARGSASGAGGSRAPLVRLWGRAEEGRAEPLAEIRRALADSQKVLLLVWWREEKLLELASLENRFLAAENALNAVLADDDEEKTPRSGRELAFSSEDPGVPWRVIMDAALPFLPENGAFFSADEAMALDLRDAGMLRPLPEDSADMFSAWPGELVSGLLYAELPAWRFVGRKGPLAERPWLERTVELFVARPRGGWA